VTVTFDKPLESASLEVSNWTLVHDGGFAMPSSATSAASTVVLQFSPVSGPQQIGFNPPPFDVVGENGLAVQAFTLPI
jgi:hypothetical protein